MKPDKGTSAESSGWLNWKTVTGGLLVALGIFLFVHFDLRSQFRAWFKSSVLPWLKTNPVLAPFAYMVVYVVAVVAFMPGSVLTIPGGALFGPILGTIYVSLASTVAAGLAFLVARYLAADWVERKVKGQLKKVKTGIEKEGWKFVAFTRLVPIFPYNLLNYMFGLTRINFWVYFFVSWVAMLPGTFAYVYAGYATKVATAGGQGVKRTLITVGIAFGLLIFASMIPRFVRMYRGEAVEETIEDATDAK